MPDTAAPDLLLDDVCAYLDRLVRERASPQTAQERLQPLRARHPDADIDIVWEAQSFDGSLHFDALVRPGTDRTISLSVCPDDALPWPLRGLQRWKDSDLLRVDGRVLSVADAVTQLDMLWERAPLMQRLVDHCLVDEALARTPVEVTDEEVQHAFDAMRRARGLLGAADVAAWMRDTGVTWPTLEAMATQLARIARLREHVVGDQADAVLAGDLGGFDEVVLATVHVASHETARAVHAAAERDGHGLLHAAQQVVAAARRGAAPQPALRRVRRRDLDAAVADAIAAAGDRPQGTRVGPVASGDGWLLAEVLGVEPADASDPQLRGVVVRALFEQWLREKRAGARIEWFWGRASEEAAPA